VTVSAKVGVDVGEMVVDVRMGAGVGVPAGGGVRLAQAARKTINKIRWKAEALLLDKANNLHHSGRKATRHYAYRVRKSHKIPRHFLENLP
jgi:hypothetical protein